MSVELPSLIICSPQEDELLDPSRLSRLRSFLIHNPNLQILKQEVLKLEETWELLASTYALINQCDAAPLLRSFVEWIKTGDSCGLRVVGSGLKNTKLALLTVLDHLLEYTAYTNHIDHPLQARLEHLALDTAHDGGVQGLAIGVISAIVISCSKGVIDLAKYGAISLRLALCVGVFMDFENMQASEPKTSLEARWNEGKEKFYTVINSQPQAEINGSEDKSSATVIVSKSCAADLMRRLEEEGISIKQVALHDRNSSYQKLLSLCSSLPILQFPENCYPLVPLRCNSEAEAAVDGAPLHETVLRYALLENPDCGAVVAQTLALVGQRPNEPRVLLLGSMNCIPSLTRAKIIRPKGLYVYPDESIAILGASCRFAGSETPSDFWKTIRERKSTLGKAPGWRGYSSEEEPFWGNFLTAAGAFDHAFFRKSPREATYMDPQQRLALHLAYEALESSGYFSPTSRAQTDDVGCYVGVYSSDYEDNVNARPPTAFSFTGTARAFASGRISQFFGWTGPSLIFDTACSSSGVAIHQACRAILSGECTMALAGGVNLIASPKSHQNLAAASLMSRTGQCKPFDASADGYCRGEGGGFVFLKRLSSAVNDGDQILGVLTASAINNSKGSASITAPSLESQATLYRTVLGKAGLQPDQISYVEAHGTGTQKGDPVECHSLRRVFGRSSKNEPPLLFGSVKGNIGHSEGASGVASLVKVLLMLRHGQIAPQANFSLLNPAAPNLEEANMAIPLHLQPWNAAFRAACVNNYGAAGSNAAMIVCQPPVARWTSVPSAQSYHRHPFIITANSKSSLRQYCRTLLEFVVEQNPSSDDDLLASLAFQLAQRQNPQLNYWSTFSASSIDDFKAKLSDAHIHARANPKPVVLVFAGQTGHRPRLSRETYTSSSLLQHHLDRCDQTLQSLGFRGLFPHIFDTKPLDDLVQLHCLLFSIQYATASAWIDAGLDVKRLVGHSLGQLTALCVARVLTLRDALKMISGRASLIQSKWSTEPGSMMSMDADTATVEALIASSSGHNSVEIACFNSTSSHVVVGKTEAIAALDNAACSAGIKTKRLTISHAFHSPMVDCILDDYEKLLQELDFHHPVLTIEPCEQSGGGWQVITPELVARQSRAPVYFKAAISRIEEELGPCVWLEAGAGPAGITMARRAATNSSHVFLSAQLESLNAMESLSDTTLNLWREGVPAQFWPFHPRQRHCFRAIELPPYQFDTTHHWLPYINTSNEATQQPQPAASVAPQLLSFVHSSGGADPDAAEFTINQHSDEYAVFVGGRTVLGHILSPPSVYLESAARALTLVSASAASQSSSLPQFEHVQLHAPLGMDPNRRLRLKLEKRNSSTWAFVVDSQVRGLNKSQTFQLQASGIIKFQERDSSLSGPYRPLLSRLVDWERCRTLREDPNASVVQGAFVKSILGRVASYEDSYFGIRSITSKGSEAIAVVDMPSIVQQRCAGTRYNPPLLDNFMLVAEIHAGNLDHCGNDQVYVCNGFDALVPHGNDRSLQGTFTIYSKLERESDKVFIGDVFALAEGRNILSLAILGARFSKVPVRSFKKALEAANGSSNVFEESPVKDLGVITEHTIPTLTSPPVAPSSSNVAIAISPLEVKATIESIIRETTGVAHDSISDATLLGDLGVDSLMATELQARISDVLHINLTVGMLSEHGMTFGKVYQEIHSKLGGLPQLSPNETDISSNTSTGQSPATPESFLHEQENVLVVELSKLLAEHLNFSSDIPHDTPLALMGLDSLLAIQLQSDMESRFGKDSRPISIDEKTTFSDLCFALSGKDSSQKRVRDNRTGYPFPDADGTSAFLNKDIFKSRFDRTKLQYGEYSQKTGFEGFYTKVYQRQMSLVVGYIVEAFSQLGCDLAKLRAGEQLPTFPYAPKYEKLVLQYHQVLENTGLISSSGDNSTGCFRTDKALPRVRSSSLHSALIADLPAYHPDHELLQLTGPHLADCLSGKVDPLQLLFHSRASRQQLETFYIHSPMFATATKMLSDYIGQITRESYGRSGRLRVLEIGAGTGATTCQVLDQLVASGADFTYTFTDISPSLVAAARQKFEARYVSSRNKMEFEVLDIEKSPSTRLVNSQDLVIASNVLHATKNLHQTCTNIRKILRTEGGALCLLELTRPLPWLDCVFGLLEGWWRFADGRTYPLVDERRWESCLMEAGFVQVDWTDDESRESDIFRWILALT